MKEIRTRIAQVEAAPATEVHAEERHLNLLRQIALLGGKISPKAEPHAEHGYVYPPALGHDVERDLGMLARRNYLETRFFDRISLCPKCDSHHLNVREICPSCRGAHIAREGLLHHFRCGYVGIPSEFSPAEDGSYLCPKCNCKMHHLGTEFDRLGKAFVCRGCSLISENPPVEAVCLTCDARTPADELVDTVVFSYLLTSRGAAAIRSGSLLTEDDVVLASDAGVFERKLMLKFLDHELNRLQHFKSRFSLLLAKYVPPPTDRGADQSISELLTRLRKCLREVDVIGQLADQLYVVILPQTKWRAADALRQHIETELGANCALSLSTVEITEPRHLAQVLAPVGTSR